MLSTRVGLIDLYNANSPLPFAAVWQVFEPVRVMAANRLARDGREWTDIAGRYSVVQCSEVQ